MLTENGEQDKILYSINIIKHVIDTDLENQDMFLGMDHKANQLCHTFMMLELM
jgi:hypothetical protein